MCLLCFFAGNVGSLKTKVSGKIKSIRERPGMGTFTASAKFQSLSLKNGVDVGL